MDLKKLSLEELKAHKTDIEKTLDDLVTEVGKYRTRLDETKKMEAFKTADTPISMSRYEISVPPPPTPSIAPTTRGKLNFVHGPTKPKKPIDIEEFDPETDIAISVDLTFKGSIVEGECPPTPNSVEPLGRKPYTVRFIGNKYYYLDAENYAWDYKWTTDKGDTKGKYVGVYDPLLNEFYNQYTFVTTKVPKFDNLQVVRPKLNTTTVIDDSDDSSVTALPETEKPAMRLPSPIRVDSENWFNSPRRHFVTIDSPPRLRGPKVKYTARKTSHLGMARALDFSEKLHEKRSRSPSPIPKVEASQRIREPFEEPLNMMSGSDLIRQGYLQEVGEYVLNCNVQWYEKGGYCGHIIRSPSGAVYKWNNSCPFFMNAHDPDMNFRGAKLGYWDPIKKLIIDRPYDEIV